ncbi:MAG: NADPH-dependent F420 reductase [Euzebyaceae bacterium]|jgi:NADPH-dependent F420 reductase|nr:NADPH-dependent F420 reductase [Euzebyaceae bacterium]
MMRVGLVGGTGKLGRGLALRLASAGHEVWLGSRDAERADRVAADLGVDVRPVTNAAACAAADIVVVVVPYRGQAQVLRGLGEQTAGKPVVSAVVPLVVDAAGPRPLDVSEGSAAEQCQVLLGAARVVAGLQWVPAPSLLKLDAVLEMDVPLCSDDDDAVAAAVELCDAIKGLRAFHAGPLRLARSLEGLTPLLMSVNKRYHGHTSMRFPGLDLAAGRPEA